MVKCVLSVVVMLFVLSGICDLIYRIRAFFLYPSVRFKTAVVVVLNPESYIQQIKFLQAKFRWFGHAFANDIIFITDELDGDQLHNCKRFYDKNYYFSQTENVENILNKINRE